MKVFNRLCVIGGMATVMFRAVSAQVHDFRHMHHESCTAYRADSYFTTRLQVETCGNFPPGSKPLITPLINWHFGENQVLIARNGSSNGAQYCMTDRGGHALDTHACQYDCTLDEGCLGGLAIVRVHPDDATGYFVQMTGGAITRCFATMATMGLDRRGNYTVGDSNASKLHPLTAGSNQLSNATPAPPTLSPATPSPNPPIAGYSIYPCDYDPLQENYTPGACGSQTIVGCEPSWHQDFTPASATTRRDTENEHYFV